MPLGQPLAILIKNQLAVEPGGILEIERPVEKDLARGRFQKVRPAHDFRDAHCGVVGNAGELIAGDAISPPDDEIAEVAAGNKALDAQIVILEPDFFAVRNAEPPVYASLDV